MYSIIITKYADNDYSICITDDIEDVNSGCSVRGTLTEVLEQLRDYLSLLQLTDAIQRLLVFSLNVLKEIASIIKLQEADGNES